MPALPHSAPDRTESEPHDRSYTVVVPGQLALFEPAAPRSTYLECLIDHGAQRRCGGCNKERPIAMFSRRTASPDGLSNSCADCTLRNTRVARGVARPDASRRPSAGQLCEICGGLGGARGLHLDHDHATGLFRGWLCNRCNSAIGHLQDDPELLRRAIHYLETRRAA